MSMCDTCTYAVESHLSPYLKFRELTQLSVRKLNISYICPYMCLFLLTSLFLT